MPRDDNATPPQADADDPVGDDTTTERIGAAGATGAADAPPAAGTTAPEVAGAAAAIAQRDEVAKDDSKRD